MCASKNLALWTYSYEKVWCCIWSCFHRPTTFIIKKHNFLQPSFTTTSPCPSPHNHSPQDQRVITLSSTKCKPSICQVKVPHMSIIGSRLRFKYTPIFCFEWQIVQWWCTWSQGNLQSISINVQLGFTLPSTFFQFLCRISFLPLSKLHHMMALASCGTFPWSLAQHQNWL